MILAALDFSNIFAITKPNTIPETENIIVKDEGSIYIIY
jgi:hypothetical protein